MEEHSIATSLLETARTYLRNEYVPKIARCVELLDDQEIWWRPNGHTNSLGNLLLHLNGNLRQYIVSGVGGEADVRDRDREFGERDGASGKELLESLRTTIDEADGVLRDLDPISLADRRIIQSREMTVLEAVFHAVEHFSGHTGQIIYITKQLKNRDLAFYGFEEGAVRKRW